ncbi:MAG: hypothetical protein OEN01_06300 [Candidatus Krumholzibacteria bacterium]|nr:hypothetical protein [Candidatus Krumholzibacteria bacterium]
MIETPLEELMWQKIERTISPKDEAGLDRLLAQDARAREAFAELVKFSGLLGVVGEVEPPTALRQRIEDAIDWSRHDARTSSASPGFFEWLRRVWPPRVAVAAAAGCIVGVVGSILYNSGVNGTLDNSRFYGTIGRVANGLEIDLPAVQGKIEFRHEKGVAMSQIRITTRRQVEVRLTYDGEALRFGATGDVDSPLQGFSVDDKTLVLKNLGSGEYVAVFHREQGVLRPLGVTIMSEGVVLMEREIEPAGVP